MLCFKQQSNYAAKLRSSPVRKVSLPVQKNMTEGAKNNYALLSYKIRSDSFSVGFYIFEVFCSVVSSRRRLEDGQMEIIFNVSEVNESLTTYA